MPMKVRELMTSPAHTCRPQDSLAHAAGLLWDHDCGMLPVVDHDGRVGATVTDRDICMGAWSRGAALDQLRVADCMSRTLFTCRPDDEVVEAAAAMIAHQVHRLPVVDAEGKLAGLLSLNDLALAGEQDATLAREAMRVLAGVSRHRAQVPALVPPADGTKGAKPAGKTLPKAKSAQAPGNG